MKNDNFTMEKIENTIYSIFQDILGLEKYNVGKHDTFYNLGGDSLKLITLLGKVNTIFNIRIDLRFLFKKNSVLYIAKLVKFYLSHPKLFNKKLESIINHESLKLSFEQYQIWVAHSISDNKSLYNVPWVVEIIGKINEDKLSKALEKIVTEEDIFRCSIISSDNEPEMLFYSYVPFNYKSLECDSQNLDEALNKIISESFNLETAPLYRFRILRTKEKLYLCCIFHHLIIDSQSLNIFSNLLSQYYNNENINRTQTKYKNYISFQTEVLNSLHSKKQNTFWKNYIRTEDTIKNSIHINKVDEKQLSRDTSSNFELDGMIFNKAKIFASKNNLSIFPVLLSIFNIVISKLYSQNEFGLAIPVSTRLDGQFANTIGLFINLLPFKNVINSDSEYLSYVNEISVSLIKLYRNIYTPHSAIQEASILNSEEFNKFLNIAFSFDVENKPTLNNLKTNLLPVSYIGNKFDLTFFVKSGSKSTRILIEFNPKLFSKELINSIFTSYVYALKFILKNQNQLIKNIPLCSQKKLLKQSIPEDSNETILKLLSGISKKYPNKIALSYADDGLSYLELEKRSNQVANYLKSCGFKSGDKIAILMDHSIDLIITIIAILKSSCAYVPIHPSTPKDRIKYILDQSEIKIILADKKYFAMLDKNKSYDISIILENIAEYSIQPLKYPNGNNLAYIIFTSGSTGNPKGVMITHNNLFSLFCNINSVFNFDNNDNWILFHSYSFDFSVWEIFGALLQGATLIIPDENLIKSPNYLYNFILEKNITILNQTPSAFSSFSVEAFRNLYFKKLPLKYIIFGGEAINNQLVTDWFKYFSSQQIKLVNMYGITEASIHVTFQLLNENSINDNHYGTPIGKPLVGNNIVIMDENLLEVPIGFPGEMYISGNCVAQGYTNQDSLTQERFLHLTNLSNQKFYRSGDIAIKNTTNTFSYLGRNDDQVKIRGYRIELNELRIALTASEDIQDIVLVAKQSTEGQKSIEAFLVPNFCTSKALIEILKLKEDKLNHLTTLANGLTVVDKNPSETNAIYKEIFEYNNYFRHGIHLPRNSIVFDVGSNIGLFSLQVGLHDSISTIYAFEPIPELLLCLNKNIGIYGINAITKNIGLSNVSGNKEFAYFSNVTSMSTYVHQENEHDALLRSSLNNDYPKMLDTFINEKLKTQYLNCKVETLSAQIELHQLDRIDLLKIDVEGAELDVLKGIDSRHWNIIKQIVVEVNDINNRLDDILNLLNRQKYIVYVDKVENFRDSTLHMVYAMREQKSIDFVCKIPVDLVASESKLISNINKYVRSLLPEYFQPSYYRIILEIPKTFNGKTDYKKLEEWNCKNDTSSVNEFDVTSKHASAIQLVSKSWCDLLNLKNIPSDSTFFEVGGTSLIAIQLAHRLSEIIEKKVSVVDIFRFPTIDKLANHLSQIKNISNVFNSDIDRIDERIAIIGMEGIFPKANNINDFWNNLLSGTECLTSFMVDSSDITDESLIPIAGIINNAYDFDAHHFKMSPAEAKLLDPQQRLLLEVCYLNLKNANIDVNNTSEKIGVFASVDESTYVELFNDIPDWKTKRSINFGNSRDFIASRLAFKLGLKGPAITISTACSSSLVGCAQAANSLLRHECDIAVVCASSLVLPEVLAGYYYEREGIMSKDGRCAPFDLSASGTIPGSAVVSIILKRRSDAISKGDNIFASINDYSVNNDSNDKASYMTPSFSGQKKCLDKIYRSFNHELDFLEAHGTGTKIGDAIEIRALSEALSTNSHHKIPLGSVKANLGHAGAASGLCGLIKAALILNTRVIPPQINFTAWGNLLKDAESVFRITKEPENLRNGICYAGISSFGIGGTNVHVLLESENTSTKLNIKYTSAIFKTKNSYLPTEVKIIKHQQHDNLIKTKQTIENLLHIEFIKDFLNIIAQELDLKSVMLKDNFFDLGGDSLLALTVLSKIFEKYNITINIDDFYKSNNLEDIAVAVLKQDNKNVPRLNFLTTSGEKTLIIIHPGGGSTYQYDFIKNVKIKNLKIITIENQVINDIGSNVDSLEKMATYYISMIDKKLFEDNFILAGWSFGGNVAYEMGRQLNYIGKYAKQIIMFDSWAVYSEKFNDFDAFKRVWFNRLDKSYIYEDDLWKKMLWKRLKMLIDYKPLPYKANIKLYKAIHIDSILFESDEETNFWKNSENKINVISVNATHQSILDVMQKENMFINLINKHVIEVNQDGN